MYDTNFLHCCSNLIYTIHKPFLKNFYSIQFVPKEPKVTNIVPLVFDNAKRKLISLSVEARTPYQLLFETTKSSQFYKIIVAIFFFFYSSCYLCMLNVTCYIFVIKLLFHNVSNSFHVTNTYKIAKFWEIFFQNISAYCPFLPHTHRHSQYVSLE